MLVNLNGKLINENNAVVSVNNRSFRYGDGCFETMKAYDGNIPLSSLHFGRLLKSLVALQFDCPNYFTPDWFAQQVKDLLYKNGHTKLARVRLTVYRGNGGLFDPENMFPNWLIQSWPLQAESNHLNENGLVVGIYPHGFKAADQWANIKSNNFLLYSQAALFSKQQHWNDALVLNHRQTIADATIANLFVIKGNTIITPPLEDGPVAGVMRQHLLNVLPGYGYSIQTSSLSLSDIAEADEAFLSNAVFGMRWIHTIGDKTFLRQKIAALHKALIEPLFSA